MLYCFLDMSSPSRAIASFFFADFFGSVLRFPLWWYTEGLASLVRWLARALQYRVRGYALSLWIRHFFVPMYGAYDWVGRLISMAMRAAVITARSLVVVIEVLVSFGLVLLWCFAPIVCVVFLIINISFGLHGWSQPF